ncbi:MAG TPA: phosphoribosylglycinamide formyltransferase [Planctomycetota bacterium]|nr:phosphoribosylglycinamide formyltransferase [Planctomycetota bacterium]
MPRLKLAVLLSGNGTTLENLFEKSAVGALDADIAVVVSSRADAFGLERARRRNVPAMTVARKEFKNIDDFSAAVYAAIAPYKVDLICHAGFMCMLRVPPDYENRMVNVHPALLPAFGGKGFYGHFVHEAVLKHGCKISGCTVHFVDNVYDNGPIIAQRAVPVFDTDTPEVLGARVQQAERELYPEAIQVIAEGRIKIVNRVVVVCPKRS